MKAVVFSGIVLACLIGSTLSQTCDPNSSSHQCEIGEVCRGTTCEKTRQCDNDRECVENGGYAGDVCVDFICQPELCSAQGTCAGDLRYECSSDSTEQRCVETLTRITRQDREGRIYFSIVPFDSYVMWYKGSRAADDLIITKDTVTGVTTYYNDWCNGTSPCSSSNKGEVLSYGWLKIYNIQPDDGGYYYWNQNFTYGKSDPGYDYQINIVVNTKECNSTDNTKCWFDEICRDGECVPADRCQNNNDTYCPRENDVCVGTYCQPEFCNSTGDCARYKFCSNDTIARCIRPSYIFGREDRERRIYLPDYEPFDKITWYKYNRDTVIIERDGNVTTYHGDWCDGPSPCQDTTKGRLEDDGDLTIFSCALSDEAYYFYNLEPNNGKEDPGNDYQIDVRVPPNVCNSSIDSSQCYWDEICMSGRCNVAERCSIDANCTTMGHVCVSDYCQPEFCDWDNECAAYYSYRCSDDNPRRCVRSSYYFSQREDMEATISPPFTEPYNAMQWYKNNRATGKIAEQLTDGSQQFHGDWCQGASPCTTSHRGQIETNGDLKFFSARVNDSDYYFYNLETTNGADDPGKDYQILLRVYQNFAPTAQCGGDLSASTGAIRSVNYPTADYRNYLLCYWNLNIPTASEITWTFTSFDLEECCYCDYVEFEDSTGKVLGKYCQGNTTVGATFTTPNDIKISFISDYTINRPGFELTWEQTGTVSTTAAPPPPSTTAGPPPPPTTTGGPPPPTTTGGPPPPTTTGGPPPPTTTGGPPPPTTTGGPPPPTTTGGPPPPTTTEGPPPPTTTGDGSSSTTGDDIETTTMGAMATVPGVLTMFVGAVLVLVFKW